jgi:hypothetical protein
MSALFELRYTIKSGRIRALSIRQPWCHRILHEGKDIENRDWYTSFRGRCLIHASKSEAEERHLIREMKMPLGAIVGAMNIIGCVQRSDSRWFQGIYGFQIEQAIAFEPVPCKGALGFFKVDETVLQQLQVPE